jgi:hypothetical protein
MNMRYSTIAQKDLKINVRLAGYFIAKVSNIYFNNVLSKIETCDRIHV